MALKRTLFVNWCSINGAAQAKRKLILSYVKAIAALLDFRKASGVTDANLRCFTITEVYLRRAKENLRKKKNVECTRNFDLEALIELSEKELFPRKAEILILAEKL